MRCAAAALLALFPVALLAGGVPLDGTAAARSCAVSSLRFVRSATCAADPARASCWEITVARRRWRWPDATLPGHILGEFRRLAGCRGRACAPLAVPCARAVARSPADPSDALWFDAYNTGGELVVLARAGALALAFFVAAIVCEGAVFRPRRTGVARVPLAALSLLALSALLQLLLVPRRWQPALAGSGFGETAAYIALVVFGAVILPGAVLFVQTAAVLCVNLLLLVVQIVFWTLLGVVQFSGTLLYFHGANLWLQIRALYQVVPPADAESAERDAYMSQLYYSSEFLRMLGQNALMVHVAATVNEICRMVLRSTMAPHLYDRLVGQHAEQAAHTSAENNETTPLLPGGE